MPPTDRIGEILDRLTRIETILGERCESRSDACDRRFTSIESRKTNGNSSLSWTDTKILGPLLLALGALATAIATLVGKL